MKSAIDFIALSAIVLTLLSLVAGAVAVAGNVLYRSTLLKKELATRILVGAAVVGGWLAARHAAKVPFSESGLFRTSSDTRGR